MKKSSIYLLANTFMHTLKGRNQMKNVRLIKRLFVISIILVILCGLTGCCIDHIMEVVSQTQATCEDEGIATYKCKECGHEENEIIPATGHSFVEKVTQEATCVSTGVVEKACSTCNKVESATIEMSPHAYEVTITKDATLDAPGVEESTCNVCGDVKQIELAKLGTKENPGKVTVEQLVSEINSNKDAAKARYNEQWIEITGEVLDASHVAGMTRFYLYGKSGDSGLRIICWVKEEVLKPFDYDGEVHTFLGQVREITTVNATEIGDCEIISE